MELSKKERLMLYNQFDILEKLSQDKAEEEYYSRKKEIVSYGFVSEYDTLVEGFEETSKEICEEVKSILSMFRSLETSFSKLSDKSGIDKDDVEFKGFDENNEFDHYFFLDWYVKDRYTEYRDKDLNTHYNTLGHYRNMLKKYNAIKSKYHNKFHLLSKDEIMTIIKC